MKKSSFIMIFTAIIFLLTGGCSNSTFQAQVGETLEIGYGSSVYISDAGLTISFKGEVYDSRCPLNAYCVWAGQAEAELTIQKDGEEVIVSTAIMSPDPLRSKPARYPGYEIRMVDLEPYPELSGQADRNSLIATIRVNEADGNGDPEIDSVHFSNLAPVDLMADPVLITDAAIEGDILTLTARYSGGCKEHDYTLYMAPPAFLESYPVQANLYIEHRANNDMCEALITEVVQFNIRPIAELYLAGYGNYDDIHLNIFQYFDLQPGEYLRITYSPE